MKIKVKSHVYSKANSYGVQKGMILISKKLEEKGVNFINLLTPIFQTLIIDFNKFQKINNSKFYSNIPSLSVKSFNFAIISLIRLFYWYYKIAGLSSFHIREKDILEKLFGFIKRLKENNDIDIELQLERLRDDIDDCVSELMFVGLILNFNMRVSFKDKTDFMLENVPCEVKTIHDEIVVKQDQKDNIVIMSKKRRFW